MLFLLIFIPVKSRKQVASVCRQRYGLENERCMLFPTQKIANYCRGFIQERLTKSGTDGTPRLVQLLICPDDIKRNSTSSTPCDAYADLHIVLFPKDAFCIAKEFWQHTGLGISSRLADKCLSLLSDGLSITPSPTNIPNGHGLKGHNRHYSIKSSKPPLTQPTIFPSRAQEELNAEHNNYFEERYGRNLPVGAASAAKSALKSRIAQGLVANQPRSRTISVSPDDVYLYPCGMAAIWNAHRLLLDVCPSAKSVCFRLVPRPFSCGFRPTLLIRTVSRIPIPSRCF